jgi:hypothetical protein
MTEEERKARIEAYLAEFSRHNGRRLSEVREVWSERAAIREYLGGLRHRRNAELRHRRNAELHAIGDAFDYFVARERGR